MRLGPIVRREGLRDLAALAERIQAGRSTVLADEVVEAMTTNETLFFRDMIPFEDLRTRVLPRLARRRSADGPIRIWSAAAASGQEAYSVAMIVAANGAALGGARVEIVATDIAQAPLVRARRGFYSQFEVERGLPEDMRSRHFRAEANGWRISPALRKAVVFRRWNLLSDLRPLGQFDVVLCRNVLIYFDHPTKVRVLEAIVRQMTTDGVLYLGGAETVVGLTDRLAAVPEVPGTYSRQDARAPEAA
ncbi:MAG TPA: protein-glutamate O-methyltransferase CheR [Acetobacteraceae bacterium]